MLPVAAARLGHRCLNVRLAMSWFREKHSLPIASTGTSGAVGLWCVCAQLRDVMLLCVPSELVAGIAALWACSFVFTGFTPSPPKATQSTPCPG